VWLFNERGVLKSIILEQLDSFSLAFSQCGNDIGDAIPFPESKCLVQLFLVYIMVPTFTIHRGSFLAKVNQHSCCTTAGHTHNSHTKSSINIFRKWVKHSLVETSP